MLNVDEQARIIAGYLPEGKSFLAKNIIESNLYKFLRACSFSFLVLNDNIIAMFDELDPTTTEDLISEWETEFGIPDDCIDIADTLQERRDNVIAKITMDGVTTIADFVRVAAIYNIVVQITPGLEVAEFEATVLPFILGKSLLDGGNSLFTMFVDLPAELDLFRLPFLLAQDKLGSPSVTIVECLFNKLKPANVEAIFRFIL